MKLRIISASMAIIFSLGLFGEYISFFPKDLIQPISLSIGTTVSKNKKNHSELELIEDDDEFSSRVLSIINDYDNGEIFSKIVVDTKENTIQKDNEEAIDLDEYGIDYSTLSIEKPVMPAVAVMEAIGMDAELDETSGEIIVSDGNDEERYSFVDNDIIENSDISTEIENGCKTILNDGKSITLSVGYFDEEQAEEELMLSTEFENGKFYITNPYQSRRLVVKTKDTSKDINTDDCIESITNGEGYYVLQYETQEETKEAKERLQKDKNVKSVCCDEVVQINAISDRSSAKLMQSDRYKTYLKNNNKNTQVVVAVLDTGIDKNHSFFKGRLVTGYNVYTGKTDVTDGNGHGTHVSGIVADNTPNSVKIMPIKVMKDDGTGYTLEIKEGIDYAVKKKVNVINMSLGGTCIGDDCPIAEGVKNAEAKGVTVVVAAGNETDNTSKFCPARLSSCITVAACDIFGRVCDFSNFGNAVDVTAPGSDVLSTVPGGGYEKMSGTSMACPFIAAAAAMIITDSPTLKPSAVKNKIKSYSTDMLLSGWDKYTGNGLINFGKALGDKYESTYIQSDGVYTELEYFSNSSSYMITTSVERDDKNYPTDRTFTVKSSNPNVATFDGRYIVPKGNGTATITISIPNGKTAECTVKVKKIDVWTDYASSTYAGGKGTSKEPYQIKTAAQLAKFALDIRKGNGVKGKYYKLMNDIDLSGKYWITAEYIHYGESLIGLGDVTEAFSSTFDGNNHKIKNMKVFDVPLIYSWNDNNPVNSSWYKNSGFLGLIKGATIKNLGIENGYTSFPNTGLLAEYVFENSSISNCFTSGFSAGNGLLGEVFNSNITVKNCYSSATVLGDGIATTIYSSNEKKPVVFSNVFFCGEILDNDKNMSNTGFSGNILANKETENTRLYNCFSTAKSPSNVGFAASQEYSRLYKCYYSNANSCAIENSVTKSNINCIAKSASFFKTKSNYTNTANWNSQYKWDFTNTWAISSSVNNGYPYLKAMKPSGNKISSNTGTWLDYAASSFAGGKGTRDNPYIIKTPEQLARISYLYKYGGGTNYYYKLNNNIDLSGHNWYPIGASNNIDSKQNTFKRELNKNSFFANIDGNGKTISNMTVKSVGDFIGFAAICDSGTISNLNFVNANVKGNDYVGVVCGYSRFNHSIINCKVNGSVIGNTYVGGVCGYQGTGGMINGVESTVSVTADSYAGGITGYSTGSIEQSSYKSKITCSNYSGGIVGEHYGPIENCYSISNKNLISENENGIVNCYYINDYEKTYLVYNEKLISINKYKKLSKADELKNTNNFDKWDFKNIWQISSNKNNGYPYLLPTKYKAEKLPTDKWENYAASSYAGGNGSKTNPYLIATSKQLVKMYNDILSSNKLKYYKLISDINLGGKLWPSHAKISNDLVQFIFEGNNKTISNMTCENGGGLFDIFLDSGGVIKNLNLVNVKGINSSGIVTSNYGTISNCYVSGTIRAGIDLTGFYGTELFECGGITSSNSGTIKKCTVNADIIGDSNCASIAGYNNGNISNCAVYGTISGDNTGIFVDNNSFGSVKNCFALLRCTSKTTNNNIKNCINSTNCYGEVCISDKYKNQSLEKLKDKSTYKNWDFKSVWKISKNSNNGYPEIIKTTKRKIKYVTNGSSMPKYAQYDYIVGSYTYLQNPNAVKGKKFIGWYKEPEFKNKVTYFGDKDIGNITVYAKWKANTYTVKFNANGGTGSMKNQSMTYGRSNNLSANSFTAPNGKVFAGWSTKKGATPVYKNKQSVKNLTATNGKTVTLYANWITPKTYSITYKLNGGKMPKSYNKSYKSGTGCSLPKPTRKGYTFVGWYKDKDLKNKVTAVNPWYSGNKTYYAKWKANTYTIKFNANGGTGSMKSQSMTYNKEKNLSANSFTAPKGKVFAGWSTKKDSTPVYKNKQSVKNLTATNGKTVTLYANWITPKTYSITYKLNGGKMPKSYNKSYKSGTGCSLPKPTRKGYTFVGWYSDKACKNKVNTIYPWYSGKKTLYAKWKK